MSYSQVMTGPWPCRARAQGMVNIRGDDDMDELEVLSSFDPRHQEEVLAMKADPQVRRAQRVRARTCKCLHVLSACCCCGHATLYTQKGICSTQAA